MALAADNESGIVPSEFFSSFSVLEISFLSSSTEGPQEAKKKIAMINEIDGSWDLKCMFYV